MSEQFLASASVLIRPDTSTFRAKLEAELTAIIASAKVPPITIPVLAAGGQLGAAAADAQSLAASEKLVAENTQASNAALTRNRILGAQAGSAAFAQARAENLVAKAQAEIVAASEAGSLATTKLARTRAVLAANTSAVVISERALAAAVKTEDAVLIQSAADTLALARENEALAGTAAKDALATRGQAAAHEQFRRAIGATAAAQAGLRGATLAASGPFIVGAVAAITFFKAIQSATGLEEQFHRFQAATGATADQMKRLETEARRLSSDLKLPLVSTRDAAEAMTELAKSGLSVRDAMDAARGSLLLARATQTDIATASQTVAAQLNAFGLAGSQAAHVADLLTAASDAAQVSVDSFGSALQQVAPAAKSAGLSIDQVSVLLTELERGGIQGSAAGSQLRLALQRLASPAKTAREELGKLRIDIRDAQGNIRPDVFIELGQALSRLSKQQRDTAIAAIFSARSTRVANVLIGQGQEGLNAATRATERQGIALQQAQGSARGLGGQAKELSANLSDLGATIGADLTPVIQQFLSNVLIPFVGGLNSALQAVGSFLSFMRTARIDPGTARSVSDLTHNLADLETAANTFGAGKLVEGFREQGRQTRLLLQTPRQLAAAFRGSTDEIGSTLKDGIITPLEVIALRSSTAGRAFLAGFASADAKTQRLVTVVKDLERELGRVPTEKEISIVLNARTVTEGLREVARQAILEGTVSGAGLARAFAAAADPRPAILKFLNELAALPVGTKKIGEDAGRNLIGGLLKGAAALQGQSKSLQSQLDITTAPAQQLALLQRDVAAQNRAIAESQRALRLAGGAGQRGGPTALAALRAARQQRKADLGQIQQIEGQQASDAKTAADKVKAARDKANQAFLDSFAPGEQARLNAITSANLTKTLADDIATNRTFIVGEQAEITAIRERIRRLNLHGDALKAALAAIRAANQKIFDARNTIAQEQAQQKQDRAAALQAAKDTRLQILQTEIATAQITGNRALQRRLLNAEIAELENQIRGAKRSSLKRAQLLQELRQAQKDLNDLKKQTDKNAGAAKALQQAEFAFLQTQAGFAANLIGNLIPGGLTGLVGGTTASGIRAQISPNLPIRQQPGAGGFPPGEKGATPASQVGHAFTQALAQRDRGVTSGQGNTQIELLRRLLAAVNRLNRSADHPEAKHQRRTGAAIMDYHGESAGM